MSTARVPAELDRLAWTQLLAGRTTAADLADRLAVPAAHIDVTPLGTDLHPAPAGQVAGLRRRLDLDGPYLLGLARSSPTRTCPP